MEALGQPGYEPILLDGCPEISTASADQKMQHPWIGFQPLDPLEHIDRGTLHGIKTLVNFIFSILGHHKVGNIFAKNEGVPLGISDGDVGYVGGRMLSLRHFSMGPDVGVGQEWVPDVSIGKIHNHRQRKIPSES